jgi:predicted phosphohydrolase
MDIGKTLITFGIVIVVIGVLYKFIGRLPGDILIKKGNTTFFFPIVTSIVVSVVFSLLFYLFGKFR